MWALLQALVQSYVFLLSIPIFIFWYYEHHKTTNSLFRLPRPSSTLPFLGNTLDLGKKQRHRLHDWFTDECVRHAGKPWLLTSLGRPLSIVLTTTSTIEDVLQTQFETFVKGKISTEIAQDMFGEGIIAVDGEKWLHQRKISGRLFSSKMLRTTVEYEIIKHVETLIEYVSKACEMQQVIDFKSLMEYLTLDVFTKIGFGVDLDGLKGSAQYKTFMHAITRAPKVLQLRTSEPVWWWKLKKFLDYGNEKEFRQDIKIINDFIFDIINQSITKKTTKDADTTLESDSGRKDLIELFLDSAADSEIEITPKFIRDMTLTYIAAGKGTTSHSLCWIMVMLNRNPRVLEKIRNELHEKLPALIYGTVKTPTRKELGELIYLEAAIKESLRLNPAAPVNGRVANKDTILSDGTFVPEGTRAVISSYAIGRMKSIWGDDAAEYKPERWIDFDTGKLIQVSPFKFTVFHAGPRYCLGAKFAMMEMKMTIASLISRFDLPTLQDPFAITYELSLSLPIKGPLMIRPGLTSWVPPE